MISGFEGEPTETRPYEIVDRDSESVVIRCPDVLSEYLDDPEDRLQQIHFADNFYWIALGNGFCEWFRKIES